MNNLRDQIIEIFSQLVAEMDATQSKVTDSLALLNKEVGKIGVEKYAAIFEDQAIKHSSSKSQP